MPLFSVVFFDLRLRESDNIKLRIMAGGCLAVVLIGITQHTVSALVLTAPIPAAVPTSHGLAVASHVAGFHSQLRHSQARMQVSESDTQAKPEWQPTNAPSEAEIARLLDKASDKGLGTVWRRAAFWEPGKATLLELVNVLGRWDSHSDWYERTEFIELDKSEARAEDERNALTEKRHEMALRMKCAERAAFFQNVPNRPFTNEALAASVGLTAEDFDGLSVSKEACEVLYDALAESRSTLIPYEVIDQRRNSIVNADGSFNEIAFRIGHTKSTVLFIVGVFIFGKANFIWVLVGVKLLHDARPDLIPGPKELGLFKIWGIV